MDERKAPEKVDFEDEDEIITQPELEFDFENTIVRVVDGIVISNDNELIRLLFYYYKAGENLEIDDRIECKAVIELRVSRKNFLYMAKEFENKARSLSRRHKKLSDFMFG